MKSLYSLLYCIIAILLPSASYASECKVSASARCYITDTRDELKEFNGMACKKFQNSYKIDKEKVANGSYSGEKNENGFPLIKVKYHWNICNENEENQRIRLDPTKTGAVLRGSKVPNLNGAGVMKSGKCRYAGMTTVIDTELRNHPLAARIKGNIEGTNEYCFAYDHYNTRLQYSDDCKLEAYTDCFLVDSEGNITDEACQGRIKKLSNNQEDCTFVRVAFQWKVCNGESFTMYIKQNQSNFKMDGKKIGSVTRKIAAKRCEIFTRYRSIDTCDMTKKTMGVGVRGDGERGKGCRDYSYSELKVEDAVPSASPSFEPTVSLAPSASPSSSQLPSISSHPSLEPTAAPSASPTTAPSASPSSKPTVSAEPSMAPTSSPSAKPTSKPSVSPTSTPTANPSETPTSSPTRTPSSPPTLSSIPTEVPTPTPSKSSMPSCVPSYHPSTSAKPSPKRSSAPSVSIHPTSRPTETLSNVPTDSPTVTLSGAPSNYPTEGLSSSPTDPSRPTKSPTGYPSVRPTDSLSNFPTEIVSQNPTATICTENSTDLFYLKRNDQTNVPIKQSCSWLSGRSNKQTICDENTESLDDGTGPAREVCKITCGICSQRSSLRRRHLSHKKKRAKIVNRCQE